MLVQQGLVLLVARTEVLQKLMRQPHYLLHLGVLGLRGRRQTESGWQEKACLSRPGDGVLRHAHGHEGGAGGSVEGPLCGDAQVPPCSDRKEARNVPVFP